MQIINEDLEKYKEYLVTTRDCLLCAKRPDKIWAIYDSYKAVQCSDCGFVWINPCLNKKGMDEYYDNYIGMRFEDKEKTQQRSAQYKIDKEFIENFISSGKVLDVGCSGGFFLSHLSERFEKYGIEVDSPAVEYAKNTYSFGVEFCELEDVKYPTVFFDLIVMRGVIEHIPDPRRSMEKVSYLLKPNGYFYIAATPNIDSFCAGIYREKWNQFHPVRHLSYFNVKTISRFLSKYGLKLIAKDFPYQDTPYADIDKDHIEALRAYQARKEGKFEQIGRSRAFWGNMMNLVFKKEDNFR
jgi:2-polyprenyl-3-methyl-5-hydroxy-6-metoxy-1,4-benzoquinol methylase